MENTYEFIESTVHELYWMHDTNCARTTLICLSGLFDIPIEPQVMDAALGMHGAGGYRAQCGLVEGTLMFTGILLRTLDYPEMEIISACYQFANEFEQQFGSLTCKNLRPTGFQADDPPHMCEKLTCDAIYFSYRFLTKLANSR